MKKINLICVLLCILVSAKAQSTNGLIAHWNFNGSTNDVFNTHHGIPHGVSVAVGKAGLANTAYYFSDTVSYITVPYQADMNLSQFSISAVLKVEDFYSNTCQGNFVLIRGQENYDGNYGLSFFDNAYNDCNTFDTSKFVFYPTMKNGGPTHTPYQYSPNIVRNQWYCVTVMFDGQKLKTYVDGVHKSTNNPTGQGIIGNSNDNIYIGRNVLQAAYPFQFNGYIDDMLLYNRALADSEIVNYCNSFNGDIGDTTHNDTNTYINYIPQPQINLYPNPNKGNFKIAGITNTSSKATIQILNAVGQVIYADEVQHVNRRGTTRK